MGGHGENNVYLLIFTAIYCIGCFALALIRRKKKSAQVKRDGRSLIDDFLIGNSQIDEYLTANWQGVWHGKKRFGGRAKAKSSLFVSDKMIEDEMQEVFNLAAPWTLVEVISYTADLAHILIISHFLGDSAMFCYSTTWFILDIFNVISSGLYGSCYKHVNNAIADGNHNLAGTYIQISVILYAIIAIPSSIAAVICMESMMGYYGYDNEVVNMSTSYAAIASLTYVIEGGLAMAETPLEIDGHAKFHATFGLCESLVSIILTVALAIALKPSLFVLGLMHFAAGLVLNAIYFYIVHYSKGWLTPYMDGIFVQNAIQKTDRVKSVIKRSVPLLLGSGVQSVEWFILSLFAAQQGVAEVWILLSYIWVIIDVIPSSYASAASSRVAYNLSIGKDDVAGYVAAQSLFVGTIVALIISVPVMIFRRAIVWCVSADDNLSDILLEVVPYIVICQPFITLGMVATALNEALCMYHHAVKINLLATLLVTIPMASIFTFAFDFKADGLAAAVCMGYVTAGVANLNMYVNADWKRAERKNKQII